MAVTHVLSLQHWKIQAQSLCLTLYLCLYLYFSSWAVDMAHISETPALANTESGRRCLVFLFVFVDFYSSVRGQRTWLVSLVSSVGKYAEWSLGIDES